MRPQSSHFVLTPASSIVYGNHYIPVSCLQDVIIGVFQEFFSGSETVNTDHPEQHMLLRRLIRYLHENLTPNSPGKFIYFILFYF